MLNERSFQVAFHDGLILWQPQELKDVWVAYNVSWFRDFVTLQREGKHLFLVGISARQQQPFKQ